MLGQPPYCSLFSVWWADGGLHVRGFAWMMCACVCTQPCAMRDGTRLWQGKKVPTLSHPPTRHPRIAHVYFSPNWILYYKSSQVWTSHFPLLSLFCRFLSSQISTSCVSFFSHSFYFLFLPPVATFSSRRHFLFLLKFKIFFIFLNIKRIFIASTFSLMNQFLYVHMQIEISFELNFLSEIVTDVLKAKSLHVCDRYWCVQGCWWLSGGQQERIWSSVWL